MTKDPRSRGLRLCIGVLHPLLRTFTRSEWSGAENLPASGGFVLAVNHISQSDPLVVGHFLVDNGWAPCFLGKAELFAVPVLGSILRSAGQIPVHRRSSDAASSLALAEQAIREGRCVVVYPEGTITRDPQLWPMVGKTGAARIALATGCPLIPVGQWGAHRILAPYDWRLKVLPRKRVRVRAGAPVDLSDLAGQPLTPTLLRQAGTRVTRAITELVAELRGEHAPETPYDQHAHTATTGTSP